MTEITIALESPLTSAARDLIAGSEAAMRAVFAQEDCYTFSAEQLNEPNIAFFVARQDTTAVGCIALVKHPNYGEVKRLFVPKTARGLGIAEILMTNLENHAHKAKLPLIYLETGGELIAAVTLYTKLGYTECGPFGDYSLNPASLFMEKPLD